MPSGEAFDVVYPDPDEPGAEVRIGPWPSRSAAQHLARAVTGQILPHDAACEAVTHRRTHRRAVVIDSPEALRAWLDRMGYSAADLAGALGRSRAGVYHWLSGRHRMPPDLTTTLAGLGRRGRPR